MNVTFEGGTEREHALFTQTTKSLLNLDLDGWTIDLTVTYVDDPSAAGHNDLAATTTDGNGTGTIEFRRDLDKYKGYPESFYMETVAHEIGHLLTANLAPEAQAAIAALFGTNTGGILTFDVDTPWEDRTIEGVAETFKDAFLPQHLRYFANRTNVHLPISIYPEFRRQYRLGQTGGGRFCYLYGSDAFRVTDEWGIGFPLHLSPNDEVAFVKYQGNPVGVYPPGYGVEMNQFTESGEMMFSIVDVGGDT